MKKKEKMNIIANYLAKQKSKKELIGDVYLALAKANLNKYKTEDSLLKLCCTSIKNMQTSYYRKQQREHIINREKDISKISLEEFIDDFECNTIEEYEKTLENALNKLNETQREIVLLVIQGKKNKEIAKILNINENTVNINRKRAMDKINPKNKSDI